MSCKGTQTIRVKFHETFAEDSQNIDVFSQDTAAMTDHPESATDDT